MIQEMQNVKRNNSKFYSQYCQEKKIFRWFILIKCQAVMPKIRRFPKFNNIMQTGNF